MTNESGKPRFGHKSAAVHCKECKESALSFGTLIHRPDCPVWLDFVKNGKGAIAEFFRNVKKNES